GELAREEENRRTLAGQAPEQGVDLTLRADVDAAGRIEAEHRAKAAREPARDRDLLLVAAREALHLPGRADVDLQRADRVANAPRLVAHVDRAPAPKAVVARRSDVLAHRPLRQERLEPVGGNEHDAGANRVVRMARAQQLPRRLDLAGVRRAL